MRGSSPTMISIAEQCPVWPDLAKFRHFGTILKDLSHLQFGIWENFKPTLANFLWCNWTIFIIVNGQMSKKAIKTSGHTVRLSADDQSALNLQLCIKDLPKVFRIGYFKVMSSCRQVQEKSFETNFFWSFLSWRSFKNLFPINIKIILPNPWDLLQKN